MKTEQYNELLKELGKCEKCINLKKKNRIESRIMIIGQDLNLKPHPKIVMTMLFA